MSEDLAAIHLKVYSAQAKLTNVLPSAQQLKSARIAGYFIYTCFGVTMLTLLSRLIKITEDLGNLSSTQVGFFLLSLTLGDIVSSLTGGFLLDRYPTRKVLLPAQIGAAVALSLEGFFITSGNYFLALAGCTLLGLSVGVYNVGMNIAAVSIEKASGETLLPRFHSFFSLGAAIASLISVVIYAARIPLQIQFAIVGVACLAIGVMCNKHLLDKIDDSGAQAKPDFMTQSVKLKVKRLDISLLFLAMVAIGSNLAEGAGEDWLALGISQSFGTPENEAILVLWIMLLCATIVRFFGKHIIDRFGKQLAMRLSLGSVLIGLLVACITPWVALTYFAAVFWGVGMALGYPIGISEAASHPEDSGFRTSIFTTIGSILGIAVPPLFGLLGDLMGIRNALLIIAPVLIMGLFATKILPKKSPQFRTPRTSGPLPARESQARDPRKSSSRDLLGAELINADLSENQ